MATRPGLSTQTASPGLSGTLIRDIASGAAALAAVVYFLIGFGVVYIGESSAGGAPDLLAFGLMVGGTYLAMAIALLLVERTWVWILAAVVDAGVIAGYFTMADVRTPQFEFWGLLVKGLQVVTLVALVYLVARRRPRDA